MRGFSSASVLLALICLAVLSVGSNLRPLDIKTFHSLNRVGAPVVSPNQKLALFTTSYYSQAENKNAAFISCLDIDSGNITRLTEDRPGTVVTNPLWFDQDTIGYLKRGALYRQALQTDGAASVVFAPPVPISNVNYRANQSLLTFMAAVYPNCTLMESAAAKQRAAQRPDSAMVYDNLWARHWNEWMTPEKASVFTAPVARADEQWTVGRETSLAAMLPHTADPLTRWAVDDYAVSPSGSSLAFVVRPPTDNMTWSTNVDIYLAATGGGARPRLLTGRVGGAASAPAFSWDGQRLAWLQMETAGYEADINRIYIYTLATRETVAVAYDWDASPHALAWSRDNRALYAVVSSRGRNIVVEVDAVTGKRRELTSDGSAGAVRPVDARRVLLVHSSTEAPADIRLLDTRSCASSQLTRANQDKLQDVQLSRAEDFWFTGARGDRVHGWVVRPYAYDRRKRYPLALLMHGGPQQASTQGFSTAQWNPNMYAGAGFVTVQVNFHGSPGYGQNFTDSVRRRWGDYPYVDLMRAVDYVASRVGSVDRARMVALGGSFGGYM
ncbi:Dipeptidyl-peptidase 5, partial [Coemansia sp. Cherry 401B]